MGALDKTKSLIRKDVPIEFLRKNDDNPNKMGAREFDLLCDNIEQTGLTDPILVRLTEVPDVYEIVGGHHRFDAASFLGFEEVPVTIITDPNFTKDMAEFQLVRMNMIKGKLDPQKFFDLYSKLSDAYSDEVLQDSFGFADEAEFKRLISQMAKTLPDKKLQEKFKEAAAEVKTIDGLAQLLNQMFTKYGDTLPFGYMVFDHGGQRSMWLRIQGKTMDALEILGHMCIENDRTVDDVVGTLVQLIAKGEAEDLLAKILKKTTKANLPKMTVAPTLDAVAKVAAL